MTEPRSLHSVRARRTRRHLRRAMESGVVVQPALVPESRVGGFDPDEVPLPSNDAQVETTTILPAADEAGGTLGKINQASIGDADDSSPEKPPTPPTHLSLEQLRLEIDKAHGSLPDVLRMSTVETLAERVAPLFEEDDHVRYVWVNNLDVKNTPAR